MTLKPLHFHLPVSESVFLFSHFAGSDSPEDHDRLFPITPFVLYCTVVIWISALLLDMCWFRWYCRSVCVSNALWIAQLDFLNTSLTFALLWKAQMLKTHRDIWTNNRLLIPLWYSQVYSVPTYVWSQLTMGGLRHFCRFFFTFRLV